jgi:hypothetical protein
MNLSGSVQMVAGQSYDIEVLYEQLIVFLSFLPPIFLPLRLSYLFRDFRLIFSIVGGLCFTLLVQSMSGNANCPAIPTLLRQLRHSR